MIVEFYGFICTYCVLVFQVCWWFATAEGCRRGDRCRYQHLQHDAPKCRFYNTTSGCRKGNTCSFAHILRAETGPILLHAESDTTDADTTEEEMDVDTPDKSDKMVVMSNELCWRYNEPGGCCFGDNCRYAHMKFGNQPAMLQVMPSIVRTLFTYYMFA